MSNLWNSLRKEDVEDPLKRQETLLALRLVLDEAVEKTLNRCTPKNLKASWARVAIQAAAAAGQILRDADLEELASRLERVEEVMAKG